MKRKGQIVPILFSFALAASLALLGCPNPTNSDDPPDDTGGGITTPTPVIFTDFETDIGGWVGNSATAELSTEQFKNGEQSCKVITGDAGWKSVWMYNLGSTILNDVSYDYSVWIYQESGAEVKFNITLKDSNEGYNSVKYEAPVPSGEWTELSSTFTLTADKGTADSLYIEAGTNPVTFYFDDFKVIQTPSE